MNSAVAISGDTELSQSLRALLEDLSALAECDLSTALRTPSSGQFGQIKARLGITVSNLNEVLKQMAEISTSISDQSAEIAHANEDLATRTQEQADAIASTSASMEELSGTVRENAASAERANALVRDANTLADEGRGAAQQMVEAMQAIRGSTARIEAFVKVINEVAFQTQILALNAAVEAARAGEHGRSFAVVADEVRALAQRCSGATRDIKSLIEESSREVNQGQAVATETGLKMEQIVTSVRESSNLMEAIAAAAREQSLGIESANGALARIDAITRQNRELVDALAANTGTLQRQSGFMSDAVNVFRLDNRQLTHAIHRSMQQAAIAAAAAISTTLNQAVQRGEISLEDLFDDDYQPIVGTNPQKFSTRFDALTDRLFPPLQERVLENCAGAVYAGAVDRHGYFPTHNKKFSKPLTGDYKADLAGNRTKRIFDDRVGHTCGSHTEPFKLQAYRRDTGELMFDMSAPIDVGGYHWGGFRIGYRIE